MGRKTSNRDDSGVSGFITLIESDKFSLDNCAREAGVKITSLLGDERYTGHEMKAAIQK